MKTIEGNGPSCPEQRQRWVFSFSVLGDLRFLSHHDTLRLFRRALARASLPVRYSEGFNPHPRIMMPLPRPVGIASDAEAIVIETDGPIEPEDALLRLERQTPTDLRMLRVRRLEPGERLVPAMVRYRVEPADPAIADLPHRLRQLLEADVVPVERKTPKKAGTSSVDIRPYIAAIVVDHGVVEMTLRVTGSGTAKPAEVAGLLGYEASAINHRIRRLEIQWR